MQGPFGHESGILGRPLPPCPISFVEGVEGGALLLAFKPATSHGLLEVNQVDLAQEVAPYILDFTVWQLKPSKHPQADPRLGPSAHQPAES